MFNTTLLNTSTLNSQLLTIAEEIAGIDAIVFNGMSLQNAVIVTTDLKDSSTPSREVSTFKIPRSDGTGFIADFYRERKIKLAGIVKESTSELLEEKLDEMKRRLTLREGILQRNINGNIRTIKATLTNPDQMFSKRERYHISFCPFELEFTSLEPMWHDPNYISKTNYGVTNLSFGEVIENLGTYKVPAVLFIIVEAASGVTAFEFKNTTNDDDIKITTPIVAGDIIEINGETKSVLKNGTAIDYDGAFPNMEYGTNTYQLITTGTSIQYSPTLKVKQAYL